MPNHNPLNIFHAGDHPLSPDIPGISRLVNRAAPAILIVALQRLKNI